MKPEDWKKGLVYMWVNPNWKPQQEERMNLKVYRISTMFEYAPKRWAVLSETIPDVAYTVTQHDFSCTCPDFTYRARNCKHINAVRRAED